MLIDLPIIPITISFTVSLSNEYEYNIFTASDFRGNPIYQWKLTQEAEAARIRLSNARKTHVSVPEIGLDTPLSRSQVERLFEPLLKRILEVRSSNLIATLRCSWAWPPHHSIFCFSPAFAAGSYYGFY